MSKAMMFGLIDQPEIITLVVKTRYPKARKSMRCVNCGTILEFTYDKVVAVIEGAADISEIRREVQCRKCKAIYEIC